MKASQFPTSNRLFSGHQGRLALVCLLGLLGSFQVPATLSFPTVAPSNVGITNVVKPVSSTPTPVFDFQILSSEFVSWAVDPTNQGNIHLLEAWKNYPGQIKKDVIVAVVDTGIDPTHPFLKDNLYLPDKIVTSSNFGVDFSKNFITKSAPMDTNGHGSHVSAIIKSVYPHVKLLVLKYYNSQASGQDNLKSTIEALNYAVSQNVDIINYSGGGPEPSREELQILKRAEEKGILVVAAAGNEEADIDNRQNAYYPASYGLENIITVAAHDQQLRLLPTSNYGKKSVDIVAPGVRINSALPFSHRSGNLTGTSQATAFVTGVAALIKSQVPELTPGQVKNIINQSAIKEVVMYEKAKSHGRLNAAGALELAISLANAHTNQKTTTSAPPVVAPTPVPPRKPANRQQKVNNVPKVVIFTGTPHPSRSIGQDYSDNEIFVR